MRASYTLVYLLLTTGIKKSETLGLKLEHVELDTPNGPQDFHPLCQPGKSLQGEETDPAR